MVWTYVRSRRLTAATVAWVRNPESRVHIPGEHSPSETAIHVVLPRSRYRFRLVSGAVGINRVYGSSTSADGEKNSLETHAEKSSAARPATHIKVKHISSDVRE